MGKKCNVTHDFVMQFTDMGICYTFNGDIDNVKDVDETASALSLILNVEQYEHMRGPQNDAGIKVHVHYYYSYNIILSINLIKVL